MVRFGRWQKIIDAPLPDDPGLFLVSKAMYHYAKGVAHASLKHFDDADRERQLFHDSLARIPPERKVFNNSALSILAVGEKMLDGELEYHRVIKKLAMRICGKPSIATTTSNTSNRGLGCIRQGMRWQPCWPNKAITARRRRFVATIWA